jgi:hypothetical protein
MHARVLRVVLVLAIAAAAGVFWIQHFDFPQRVSVGDLDASWQQVKGHELLHGLQVGVDTVFTYGPLGYFNQAPYDPALFWPKLLLWEGALELSLAVFFALAAWRLRSNFGRLLLFVGLVGVMPSADTYYFLSILALGAWLLDRPSRAFPSQLLACVPLTAIALDKFTYLLFVALTVAVASVAIALEDRKASWRLPACFLATFAATWMLLGQSLANVPRYLATSWEILSGYNQAMAVAGPEREAWIAMPLFALGALAVVLELSRGALSPARVASGLLCLAGLYLAGKAGFVRHGSNSLTFFAFAGPAALLVLPSARAALRGGRSLTLAIGTLRTAAVVLGIVGCAYSMSLLPKEPEGLWERPWYAFKDAFDQLRNLESLHALREGERQSWARYLDLPKMRARIGDATVDSLFTNQGILLINGFRYHPRPVFQSYSAYTPGLAALNGDFYASDRGPRFVILGFSTADDRLPSLEDAQALQELLRHYRAVLSEKGLLLFERLPAAEVPAPRREVLLSRRAKVGEKIDLGGDPAPCQLLSIRMRRTALGRLRSMVYKASEVSIEIERTDGEKASHRFVPGMAESGVLSAPYFDSQSRWVEWMCGAPAPAIRSFRIRPSEGCEYEFDPELEVELVRADDLVPKLSEAAKEELRWSMFETRPDEVVSQQPPKRIEQRFHEALVVEPPGYLRYGLSAGRYRVLGRYGVAQTAIDAGCTEGGRFLVYTRGQSGEVTVLLDREIDPIHGPEGPALQRLDLEFVLDEPGDLFLRTRPRIGTKQGCDWTCWSQIEIRPLPNGP